MQYVFSFNLKPDIFKSETYKKYIELEQFLIEWEEQYNNYYKTINNPRFKNLLETNLNSYKQAIEYLELLKKELPLLENIEKPTGNIPNFEQSITTTKQSILKKITEIEYYIEENEPIFQNDLTYKLGVYETPSYGEYSPTGKCYLEIYNKADRIIFFLESNFSSYNNYEKISYTCFVKSPFLELIDNIDNPFQVSISDNYDVINVFVDSIFLKAKKILSNHKVISFDQSNKKRDINSSIVVIYQNDTLVNEITAICSWRFDDIIINPELAVYATYSNNEVVEQLTYSYSERDYDRQNFDWNSDSTEQTYRFYNKFNILQRKSISEYNSDRKLIGQYSIGKSSGEKIISRKWNYISNFITEELFYTKGKAVGKIIYENNEFGDLIKTTTFRNLDYPKQEKLTQTEKRVVKYEYDEKGRKLRATIFNGENEIISSVRFNHGKI